MVARLEDSLGFKLFERGKTGLSLTQQGTALLRSVNAGFGQIRATIEELKREQAEKDVVTLSLYSGFVSLWLLPRFSDFMRDFPTINLHLQVVAGRRYGPLEGADLGVRLRDRASEKHLKCLCPEIIIPVCSSSYLAAHGALDATLGQGDHTLLHVDPTTYTWTDFFEASALAPPNHGRAVHQSDPGLAVQAAMLGQGVALGWLLAIATALNARKVVPACTKYISTGYDFVIEHKTPNPSTRAGQVAEWLSAEMAKELEAVKPLLETLDVVDLSRKPTRSDVR
jgi:DNA-binding transcriptional LysR family regulator